MRGRATVSAGARAADQARHVHACHSPVALYSFLQKFCVVVLDLKLQWPCMINCHITCKSHDGPLWAYVTCAEAHYTVAFKARESPRRAASRVLASILDDGDGAKWTRWFALP